MYCQNESTPTTISPTLSADNNIVPSSVPWTVPLPPDKLAPPTAAAIAFNSYPIPAVGSPVPSLAKSTTPESAAVTPHKPYAIVLLKLTFTPDNNVASSLLPSAYI